MLHFPRCIIPTFETEPALPRFSTYPQKGTIKKSLSFFFFFFSPLTPRARPRRMGTVGRFARLRVRRDSVRRPRRYACSTGINIRIMRQMVASARRIFIISRRPFACDASTAPGRGDARRRAHIIAETRLPEIFGSLVSLKQPPGTSA